MLKGKACRKRTRSERKARNKLLPRFVGAGGEKGALRLPPAPPRAVIQFYGIRAAGRFPLTTGVAIGSILTR